MSPIKKKRVRKKKQEVIEVQPPVPVVVLPEPPKESKIQSVQRGVIRGLLFFIGLTPTVAFAFDIIVLRPEHVDPSVAFVVLMLAGLATSFAVANIADDKLSKSAKEVVPIVRGVMRTSRSGSTTEHRIETQDK